MINRLLAQIGAISLGIACILNTAVLVDASEFQIPAVTVSNVSVAKDEFVAGEVLSGTFDVKNDYQTFFTDLGYRIILARDFDPSGIPRSRLDQSDISPVLSLGSRESRQITFDYVLPAYVNDAGFGIQIELYNKQGFVVGFAGSKKFIISGGVSALVPVSKFIKTDKGSRYEIGRAPAMSKDGVRTESLEITLRNNSAESVTTTPIVKIYDITDPRSILFDKKGERKSIFALREASWSIDLSSFDYRPGVYVAEIVFIDSRQSKRSEVSRVQYVVGGTVVNIHNLYSNKSTVKSGESFGVGVDYAIESLLPPSVVRSGPNGGLNLRLEVYDERDRLVASTSLSDAPESLKTVIPLTASHRAKALRGRIEIYQEGKLIKNFESNFSADYQKIHDANNIWGYLALGSAALLVACGAYVLWRRRKSRSVMLPIIFFMLLCSGYDRAQAFVETSVTTSCGNVINTGTSQLIGSTPYDDSVYSVNSKYSFTGTINKSHPGADGDPYRISVKVSNSSTVPAPGPQVLQSITTYYYPPLYPGPTQQQFSVGPQFINANEGKSKIEVLVTSEYYRFCLKSDASRCWIKSTNSNPDTNMYNSSGMCTIITEGYIPYTNATTNHTSQYGRCGTSAKSALYSNDYQYNYLYNESGFSGYLCDVGNPNPSLPDFPPQGGDSFYSCSNINMTGGVSCGASRDPVPPTTPTGATGSTSSTCGAKVDLRWNAVSGANGYYVYRSSTSGGVYTRIATVTTTSYTDTVSSSYGTTYYYKVSAYNVSGESSQTTSFSATTSGECVVVAPGSCGPINGTSTTTMPTLNSYFCTVGTKSSNAWGGNWSSLTSTTSSAGFYVTSAEYGGYIYTSDDGGVTWTKRAASGYKNWIAVTSGQNGTSPANAAHRIYGAVGGGALYKSADRGVNWTVDSSAIISGSNIWSSIIYSPNSIRAVAAVDGGYIYRMTSGNWGSSYSVNKNWKALAGSTDLTYLAAAPSGDYIYTSTNFGAAWASKTGSGSRMWSAVASSADGTKLAAAESNGYIYTASDSTRAFATWTKRTPAGASVPKAWKAITSSSDGAKLAAVANAGYIYTSTNSGGAWTARTGPGVQAWSAITSSSDGTKLVAATTGGDIYTSSDSGATWIRRWVSGSGTKYYWLCAGTGGGASSPECSLTMTMACGSANGVETASAPSSNLCNTIGSSTAPVHDTPNMKYDWMCSFPNGTVPVSCSAPEIREGECGLAAGKTYSSAPTTDLCTSTTNNPAPVAVQSGSNYVWTCTGNPAGHDASCSALVEDYKLKISNKLVVTPPVVNPGCSNNNDGCICTVSWPEGEVFEDGYNNGLTECSLSSQGHVVTGMDKFHPKNDHQNYATSTLFKDTLFTLSCWGKKNQGNVQTASGICRVNFSAKESN